MTNQVCLIKGVCINKYLLFSIIVLVVLFPYYSEYVINTEVKNTIKNNPQLKQRVQFSNKVYDKGPTRNYIPTRHQETQSQSYEQVGFLFKLDSDSTYKPNDVNRFPLYGRKNLYNSNKYDYYVSANGLKINIGESINELFTGDNKTITGFSGTYTAEIYEINRENIYNPFLE